MLPGPLGLVEDFNRDEGNLTNSDFNRLLRLGNNDGSLLLPLGPLLTKCASIKLIFIVSRDSFSLWIESTHESPGNHINHMISELVESTSSSGSSASPSATSAESPVVMTVGRFLCFDLFVLRELSHFIFIDGSNDDSWRILRLSDLQERVLM